MPDAFRNRIQFRKYMIDRLICPDDCELPHPPPRPDLLQIDGQQLQHRAQLLRDPGEINCHRNALIMRGRKLRLVGIFLQRAERDIPGGHVAVLMLTEQTLASALFAVIDLHHISSRLLMPVAIGHMHIVIDQFDTGKYRIQCNVTDAALVFQMKAARLTGVFRVPADGHPIQVDAGKFFVYVGLQNFLCKLIRFFHKQSFHYCKQRAK